eukprot:tig00001126_g7117.t1
MRDWYRRELETGVIQPSPSLPRAYTSTSGRPDHYYSNQPSSANGANGRPAGQADWTRTVVDELLQTGPGKKRDLIDRAYAQNRVGVIEGTLHMLILGAERVHDPSDPSGPHQSPIGTTWFSLVSFSGEKARSPMHPVRRDGALPEYSRGWNEKFALRASREELPLVSVALIEDSRGNRRSVGTTRFRFDRLAPGAPPVERSFPLRKHRPDGSAFTTGTIHVRLWFEAHAVQPRATSGPPTGLFAISGGVPATPEKAGRGSLDSSWESRGGYDIAPHPAPSTPYSASRTATPPPAPPPAWERMEHERRARAMQAQAARMRALRELDQTSNFFCNLPFCS